jgi:hypothetical protein
MRRKTKRREKRDCEALRFATEPGLVKIVSLLSSQIFLLPSLILLLTGCVFDDDQPFIPDTQAVYLLVENRELGTQSLWKGKDQSFASHYETQLAYEQGEVNGIAGRNRSLWLASHKQKQIRELALPQETTVRSYDTDPLQPDKILVGEANILVVDQAQERLGLLSMKDETLDTMDMRGRASHLLYQAPYFYVITDSVKMRVYYEENLRLVDEVDFDEPVVDLFFAPNQVTVRALTNGPGGPEFYAWSPSNRVLNMRAKVPYRKLRYSPYLRQETGREWLAPVSLRQNRFFPTRLEPVEDFVMDFQRGELYYHAQDSLFFSDLETAQKTFMQTFPDAFGESFVYVDHPVQ